MTLAVLDPTSREAEGLLTPLRPGGPVPQLFRAWPPGAAELAHADDGRTEVPWREGCPGCGGRVVLARSRGRERRQRAHRRLPPARRRLPRWLVVTIYALELACLIASDASGGIVAALMMASLTFGLGLWLGLRLENFLAAPG